MLERLLDLREVVHRDAEGVGQVAHLRRRDAGDLELAGPGALHPGPFGEGAVQLVREGGADPDPLAVEAAEHVGGVGVGDEPAAADDDDTVGDELAPRS